MDRALQERAVPGIAARPGYDDVTFEECDLRQEAGTREGWVKNRYAWCQRLGVTTRVTELGTERLIGFVKYRTALLFRGWNGIRSVQYDVRISDIEVLPATPADLLTLEGSTLTHKLECQSVTDQQRHCKPVGTDSTGRTVVQWQLQPFATYEFQSDQVGEGTDKLAFSQYRQKLTMTAPVDAGAGDVLTDFHTVRWDSASYLNGSGGGIFERVTPYITYDADEAKYKEATWHIWNAFHNPEKTYPAWTGKTVPGNYDAQSNGALNRLRVEWLQDLSRGRARAVCRGIDRNYSSKGRDCDEYPYAATWQGAIFQPDPAHRRFSACPIDSKQNQDAGTALRIWYANDRILENQNDRFFFRVTGAPPADKQNGCFNYPIP